MNRNAKFAIVLLSLILTATMLLAVRTPLTVLKVCCLTGEYRGAHTNNISRPCPVVKTETFTMTLNQQNCGAKAWGKIVSADGKVQEYTGVIRRGLQGCCDFEGQFGAPDRVTHFKGTFCKQRTGKWAATGTYTDADGCSGTWKVAQI